VFLDAESWLCGVLGMKGTSCHDSSEETCHCQHSTNKQLYDIEPVGPTLRMSDRFSGDTPFAFRGHAAT
jgi:hypothetical protein